MAPHVGVEQIGALPDVRHRAVDVSVRAGRDVAGADRGGRALRSATLNGRPLTPRDAKKLVFAPGGEKNWEIAAEFSNERVHP
jgi:hypothetical protein